MRSLTLNVAHISSKQKPHLGLEVEMLPLKCDDPKFVQSLNDRPGILALAMRKSTDASTGKKTLKGIPFIVPGARFNELYNWDSYFISLGLLVDGKVDMAKGMVEHFIFEIKHYGWSPCLLTLLWLIPLSLRCCSSWDTHRYTSLSLPSRQNPQRKPKLREQHLS